MASSSQVTQSRKTYKPVISDNDQKKEKLYCTPKTLLVSCLALSSGNPALDETSSAFKSTCTISIAGPEIVVKANVVSG